jgi:hypothetical protein
LGLLGLGLGCGIVGDAELDVEGAAISKQIFGLL